VNSTTVQRSTVFVHDRTSRFLIYDAATAAMQCFNLSLPIGFYSDYLGRERVNGCSKPFGDCIGPNRWMLREEVIFANTTAISKSLVTDITSTRYRASFRTSATVSFRVRLAGLRFREPSLPLSHHVFPNGTCATIALLDLTNRTQTITVSLFNNGSIAGGVLVTITCPSGDVATFPTTLLTGRTTVLPAMLLGLRPFERCIVSAQLYRNDLWSWDSKVFSCTFLTRDHSGTSNAVPATMPSSWTPYTMPTIQTSTETTTIRQTTAPGQTTQAQPPEEDDDVDDDDDDDDLADRDNESNNNNNNNNSASVASQAVPTWMIALASVMCMLVAMVFVVVRPLKISLRLSQYLFPLNLSPSTSLLFSLSVFVPASKSVCLLDMCLKSAR
jgi:hypothetical protein